MLDRPSIDVAELIARRRPGYTLEAPFHTSREIFDLDLDLIFGRHWIYVAVEPDVPEPGDYVTVNIGRNSVVIVRDDDMNIRAFHNVCRHRGARIFNEEHGATGKIVCPYHQWTYDLDGKLLFAEHMGAGFDKSCFGLKPVNLKNLAGLLFVCLAADPPDDFDDMARVMEPYLAPHDVKNTKIVKQIDIVEEGNWKLTMENNRECYHCGARHPELTISLYAYGFGFDPQAATPRDLELARQYECKVVDFNAQWEAQGLPSKLVEHLVERPTGYRAQRLPLDEAGESQTMDTRVASKKLLGNLSDKRLGGLHFWTQPNSWHHFMSDHVVTFSVLPLSPDRTLLRTKWLVHKDAEEGRDYDVDNLTKIWRITNEQDSTLVGYTHHGVESAAYEPGPYSAHTEELVDKFCDWYIRRLKAGMAE
jgi:Rieske 2Fe-2S family protein